VSGHQARIIVFARLGRATVPEEVVMKGATGAGPSLNIATLSRRYEFVFDGAEVLAAPNNPPQEPPLTNVVLSRKISRVAFKGFMDVRTVTRYPRPR
jgi:hypothetical protein